MQFWSIAILMSIFLRIEAFRALLRFHLSSFSVSHENLRDREGSVASPGSAEHVPARFSGLFPTSRALWPAERIEPAALIRPVWAFFSWTCSQTLQVRLTSPFHACSSCSVHAVCCVLCLSVSVLCVVLAERHSVWSRLLLCRFVFHFCKL